MTRKRLSAFYWKGVAYAPKNNVKNSIAASKKEAFWLLILPAKKALSQHRDKYPFKSKTNDCLACRHDTLRTTRQER